MLAVVKYLDSERQVIHSIADRFLPEITQRSIADAEAHACYRDAVTAIPGLVSVQITTEDGQELGCWQKD